jgi:hypothetical protein
MEEQMSNKKKKQWEKILSDSWVSNNSILSEEDAQKKLITAEFEIKNLKEEQENNEHIKAAKEVLKDLNAGFNSAIKHEKAKIDFLLEQIENSRIAINKLKEQL